MKNEQHQIKTGDVLALEKVAVRRYRLYSFDVATRRRWRGIKAAAL